MNQKYENYLNDIAGILAKYHHVHDRSPLWNSLMHYFQILLLEVQEEKDILHSLSITKRIADWRLPADYVYAALLHKLPAEKYEKIAQDSQEIYRLLDDYQWIRDKFRQGTFYVEDIMEKPLSICIFIAEEIERLKKLYDEVEYEEYDYRSIEQKVERLKDALVNNLQAYKIYDDLETEAFKVLHRSDYQLIVSVLGEDPESITDGESLNYSRMKFFEYLQNTFSKENRTIYASLQKYQSRLQDKPIIRKRSYSSLGRFISQYASREDEKYDLLKNTSITAYYDITILFSTENNTGNDRFDNDEVLTLFFDYYNKEFRKNGIQFLGFHSTLLGQSPYFLIADKYHNLYRLFIKSPIDYLYYHYGKIYNYHNLLMDADKKLDHKIKVYNLNDQSRPVIMEENATILDYAFEISPERALHFSYALINDDTKNNSTAYKLRNGDQIRLQYDFSRSAAAFNWFNDVNCKKSRDYLIAHFENMMNQVNQKERRSFIQMANEEVTKIYTNDR